MGKTGFIRWLLACLLALERCCQNCPSRSIFTRVKEAVLIVDMGEIGADTTLVGA